MQQLIVEVGEKKKLESELEIARQVQLQQFGTDRDVLIRVAQQPGGEQEQQAAVTKIREALGDDVDQGVFYPEDDRLLVERETRVLHYEIVSG